MHMGCGRTETVQGGDRGETLHITCEGDCAECEEREEQAILDDKAWDSFWGAADAPGGDR